MKNNIFVLALCLGIGFMMISCGDDEVIQPPTEQVNTSIEFQMRVGSDALVEGQTYTIGETAFRVDFARFYLGNITLSQDSTALTEASATFIDQYKIVTPGDTRLNLGFLDVGIYGFSFGVGVDPVRNNQETVDFSTRPEGDPLAAQTPDMHWNWNSGYKFLRVDGEVDTDGDGQVDTPIKFHLGSDAFFTILDSNQVVELSPDNGEIVLRFDLAQFLDGIPIDNGISTMTMDNLDLAQLLLDNYDQSFSLRN